jgi:hypothetical protein
MALGSFPSSTWERGEKFDKVPLGEDFIMKNVDLHGFHIKDKRLKHWSNLFKEWINLIGKYCKVLDGEEAPYYYYERTNIGILSAAACKAGWVSLEEFGFRKRGKKQGRADLWICREKADRGEYIEAKQIWNFSSFNKALLAAKKDAKKLLLSREDDSLRVGVVFVPHGFNNESKEIIDNDIEELIKQGLKSDFDAIGWTFPEPTRNLIDGVNKKIYPGILLIAKIV